MKKTLKLTGNFDTHRNIIEAHDAVVAAQAVLATFTEAGDYSSAGYSDAVAGLRSAKAAHARLVDRPRR